jgi:CBS domain-containing protein
MKKSGKPRRSARAGRAKATSPVRRRAGSLDPRENVTRVRDLMTDTVESCFPGTDLGAASMIMWRNDCGIVPVVSPGTNRVEGVITDRDICMALATSGRRANERTVGEIMARQVSTANQADDVHAALAVMERECVRRLPVVDPNGVLSGVISINDLILATGKGRSRSRTALTTEDVMKALRGICTHRQSAREEALVGSGAERG